MLNLLPASMFCRVEEDDPFVSPPQVVLPLPPPSKPNCEDEIEEGEIIEEQVDGKSVIRRWYSSGSSSETEDDVPGERLGKRKLNIILNKEKVVEKSSILQEKKKKKRRKKRKDEVKEGVKVTVMEKIRSKFDMDLEWTDTDWMIFQCEIRDAITLFFFSENGDWKFEDYAGIYTSFSFDISQPESVDDCMFPFGELENMLNPGKGKRRTTGKGKRRTSDRDDFSAFCMYLYFYMKCYVAYYPKGDVAEIWRRSFICGCTRTLEWDSEYDLFQDSSMDELKSHVPHFHRLVDAFKSSVNKYDMDAMAKAGWLLFEYPGLLRFDVIGKTVLLKHRDCIYEVLQTRIGRAKNGLIDVTYGDWMRYDSNLDIL